MSSYASETKNVVAQVIDSTINRTPCIVLAKPVEINRTLVFHPFLETIPPKQWPPWPVQDATDREPIRSEVIPLRLKLKVTKFVFPACFVQEVIAYECTHVRASEKKRVISKTGSAL
jgi:hypothetical protein